MITPNKTTEKMLRAFNDTLAILFAHESGFFRILSEREEVSEDELSKSLGIPKRSISALVSLFTSQSPPLIEKTKNGKVRLAVEGNTYLNPQSAFFMGGFIDFISKNKEAFSLDAFNKQMREDKPHRPLFEQDRAFNQQMISAMHAKSVGPASAWAEKIDFAGYSRLLDIGGGSGIFSVNALKTWPHLQVTIFELPHIVDITKEFTKETAISVVAGDFWKDTFPNTDVAFYSDIFHDYVETDCAVLAKKSFDSLPEGGRIILHELPFNSEKTGPLSAAVYNFSVIRWTHGRQYSISELKGFLEKAGFSQVEYLPTGYLDWALITGVKSR